MREPEKQYDMSKRAAAVNIAALRAAVAAYLAYLGFTLIRDVLTGASALTPVLAWAAGLLFIAGAAVFALYIRRRWRADMKGAELPASERDKDPEK